MTARRGQVRLDGAAGARAVPRPVWVTVGALTAALVAVPAVLAVLQATTFERGESIGWLGIGPLLASLVLTWRRVAVIVAYTLLVVGALVLAHPGPSTAADTVRVAVVAALGVFAVANCVIRERREAQLLAVSEVARVAQGAILQPVPTQSGRWALASRYQSASEGTQVGGDILDVMATPTGARLIVGDVRGKGLGAVHLAATALMTFRDACSHEGLSLPEVARRVDQGVAQRVGDEDFVTAVLCDLDDRGWLHMVNCGHPPPLRLTTTGDLQPLSPRVATSPLGLSPSLRSDTYTISPGDRVLFYTDGVLEARNSAGQFFLLRDHAHLLSGPDLDMALQALLSRLQDHSGGTIDDDVAVLLARLGSDTTGQDTTG